MPNACHQDRDICFQCLEMLIACFNVLKNASLRKSKTFIIIFIIMQRVKKHEKFYSSFLLIHSSLDFKEFFLPDL